uniref:Serine/threonine protein phosphatase 7 long form isogeny n=1 Tax=Cajanus cajan TaxID=3821 RepID=A0A151SH72_CAJCA|nr:Serine/threonine protein phosphatase 7 long form isogeny [Cajanus cajan]
MSWGSCVLANLYRELCVATNYDHKEIAGSGILLQLWAWYRFPFIAPPHPPLSTFHVPLGARLVTILLVIDFRINIFRINLEIEDLMVFLFL